MLRSILAVTAGVLIGALVVFIVEMIGHRMFPPPAGVDFSDPAALRAAMEQIPLGAKLAVLVAWFLGIFAGGATAALIARRWAPVAWIVAATLLAMAAISMLSVPHPAWMVIGAVVVSALGGWLAVLVTRANYGRPPGAASPKAGPLAGL